MYDKFIFILLIMIVLYYVYFYSNKIETFDTNINAARSLDVDQATIEAGKKAMDTLYANSNAAWSAKNSSKPSNNIESFDTTIEDAKSLEVDQATLDAEKSAMVKLAENINAEKLRLFNAEKAILLAEADAKDQSFVKGAVHSIDEFNRLLTTHNSNIGTTKASINASFNPMLSPSMSENEFNKLIRISDPLITGLDDTNTNYKGSNSAYRNEYEKVNAINAAKAAYDAAYKAYTATAGNPRKMAIEERKVESAKQSYIDESKSFSTTNFDTNYTSLQKNAGNVADEVNRLKTYNQGIIGYISTINEKISYFNELMKMIPSKPNNIESYINNENTFTTTKTWNGSITKPGSSNSACSDPRYQIDKSIDNFYYVGRNVVPVENAKWDDSYGSLIIGPRTIKRSCVIDKCRYMDGVRDCENQCCVNSDLKTGTVYSSNNDKLVKDLSSWNNNLSEFINECKGINYDLKAHMNECIKFIDDSRINFKPDTQGSDLYDLCKKQLIIVTENETVLNNIQMLAMPRVNNAINKIDASSTYESLKTIHAKLTEIKSL